MRGLARDQDEDEEGEHSQQAADDDGQRANVDGLEDAEEDLENIPAGVNVAEEEEEEDSSLCGAHGPVCGPGKLCGSKHELDEGSMLWPTIAFGAVPLTPYHRIPTSLRLAEKLSLPSVPRTITPAHLILTLTLTLIPSHHHTFSHAGARLGPHPLRGCTRRSTQQQ